MKKIKIKVKVKELLNLESHLNTNNYIKELYEDENVIIHCVDNNTDYPQDKINDLVEYVNTQRNNYLFQCINNERKALLFLGNGFDLALGYSTSYRDFYDSKYFKKLLNKNNTLCEYIRFSPAKELWADLECGLYYYSLQQTLLFGMNNNYMSKKFEKDFKELKRALLLYIKEEQTLPKEKDGLIKDLIYRWAPAVRWTATFNFSHLSVANLEYSFHANLFNNDDSYDKDTIIHQHGAIVNSKYAKTNYINNIAVGIDDDMKVENNHGFLYKSRQRRGNIKRLLKWMDNATTYIIFGCSMGVSDACYFKDLFKSSRNKKKYLIYGKGERNISDLTAKVEVYSGGLEKFREHNVVEFLDCEKEDETLKRTEQLLDVHN